MTESGHPGTTDQVSPCLSVVMPCFNEEETIRTALDRVLASPFTEQVVVVDDGSTDRSLELIRAFTDPRVLVVEQRTNFGKGAALRAGFAKCSSPFVIVQDADLELDPVEFGVMMRPLLEGRADVVFGSRFHRTPERRVRRYWPAAANRFLTTLSNMTTDLDLSDMETCYKAFRREVLDGIRIEEDRFGVEPELTAKVARGGWRVYEVEISYAERSYAEGKKITWRDGVEAIVCIAKYSPTVERIRRAGRRFRS